MAWIKRTLTELSRRGVIKVVGSYLVLIWLLAQGVADLFPAFGLDDRTVRLVVIAGLLLTPVVFFLAWRYDLTTKGIVRDHGAEADASDDETRSRSQSGFDTRRHTREVGRVIATWTDGDDQSNTRELFAPFVVGRDAGVDIRLIDQRVSRRHAAFFPDHGRWYVNDLGSSNGTFLDGEQVQKARLPSVCQLQFHKEGPVLNLRIELMATTLSTPAIKPDSTGPGSSTPGKGQQG